MWFCNTIDLTVQERNGLRKTKDEKLRETVRNMKEIKRSPPPTPPECSVHSEMFEHLTKHPSHNTNRARRHIAVRVERSTLTLINPNQVPILPLLSGIKS